MPPKSIAMLALGKLMPKKKLGAESEAHGDDAGGGDHDEGLQMAMTDFLDAMESKDPGAMAEAFKNAMDICGGY